jgi:formate hydrogenlyase subunit 6/NADH:ubiquinone oxidoreductase subunit I
MRPGKMIKEVLSHILKKPATILYPKEKIEMPDKFRGKLKFDPSKCIGCKLCMKDCPSGAITITKIGEKEFQAEIDLASCIYCAQCVDSCPKKALEATKDVELAQLDKAKLKVVFRSEEPKSNVTE